MKDLLYIKDIVPNYAEYFDENGELDNIVFYDVLGLKHELFKENSSVTDKPYFLRKSITGSDWHSLDSINDYIESLRKMQELYANILSTCSALERDFLHCMFGLNKEVHFFHTKDNEVNLYVKYSFEEQKFIYRGVLDRDGKVHHAHMDLVPLLGQVILGWLDYKDFVEKGRVIDVFRLMDKYRT